MNYYIVKTAYGFYNSTKSKTKVVYSSNFTNAHLYTTKKFADKRAKALNGKVLTYTFQAWLNRFNSEMNKQYLARKNKN